MLGVVEASEWVVVRCGVVHDGSFRVVGWGGVGGDPGDEDAVGVVDEVVAGEVVDTIGVACEMGGGDRDELAVAGCHGERRGPVEQVVRNGSEQCGGDQGGHVVAGLGPLDDLGDGGASPTASWWMTLSGSAGMGAAWAEPLTRG